MTLQGVGKSNTVVSKQTSGRLNAWKMVLRLLWIKTCYSPFLRRFCCKSVSPLVYTKLR
jgi:hypothetical protein